MLRHKGYIGHVEFDDEVGIFHGEVLDTRDVITFQGKNVEQLEAAFRDSIEDYLEFCQNRGEEPDKPFSGRIMLRISSKLHRQLYVEAKKRGKSLNQLIVEKVSSADLTATWM